MKAALKKKKNSNESIYFSRGHIFFSFLLHTQAKRGLDNSSFSRNIVLAYMSLVDLQIRSVILTQFISICKTNKLNNKKKSLKTIKCLKALL